MGTVVMQGSPFAPMLTGVGGECFYSVEFDANGVNIDLDTVTPNELSPRTMSEVQDELTNPENNGTVFDSITQTLERSADALDTMIDIVTGGYIIAFIDKTAIGCEIDTDPTSSTYNQYIPINNPVWNEFKNIIRAVVALLTIVSLVYLLAGRGHILSS